MGRRARRPAADSKGDLFLSAWADSGSRIVESLVVTF